MNVFDNQYCFVCGQDNPVGIKTSIEVDRDAHGVITSKRRVSTAGSTVHTLTRAERLTEK
jgi:hypothetical protein